MVIAEPLSYQRHFCCPSSQGDKTATNNKQIILVSDFVYHSKLIVC